MEDTLENLGETVDELTGQVGALTDGLLRKRRETETVVEPPKAVNPRLLGGLLDGILG